jgi:hypothetical protein
MDLDFGVGLGPRANVRVKPVDVYLELRPIEVNT